MNSSNTFFFLTMNLLLFLHLGFINSTMGFHVKFFICIKYVFTKFIPLFYLLTFPPPSLVSLGMHSF
jgi:hypothetical protein